MPREDTSAIEPAGFFALRTALLPFDELVALDAELAAPGSDPALVDEALERDRATVCRRLRSLVARPEVRDALFVASPDLEASLESWGTSRDGERGRGMERSLLKYVSRMAGRATPFGLFAGCSVGVMASRTRLVLGPLAESRRHTRLDMGYLVALTEALSADRQVRATLRFRPNSSLYRSGDSLRYVETRLSASTRLRSFSLEGVEVTNYLAETLARAEQGATPRELASALTQTVEDVSAEEAEEYVGALIDAQILVPAIQPLVTGAEAIDDLVEQLDGGAEQAPARAALLSVKAALARIDQSGVGAAPEAYKAAARHLEALQCELSLPRLYQVDLVKSSPDATLGPGPVGELIEGVALLHRLGGRSAGGELSRFRAAFVARYEQREVPLVEALDEELGLGFDSLGRAGETSPLLNGLDLGPGAPTPRVRWRRREATLLRLLSEAIREGIDEIALSPRDVDEMEDDGAEPRPLPDAFAATAKLIASSEAAVAAGDYRLLLSDAAGPSGARLLGRFCHADPQLEVWVKAHLRAEESLQPDAVFAEIVHLPEGRVGNILFRPVMRRYEIPFLGRSGAAEDRLLPVTDLTVSVRGGRFVLRSQRLDAEVIPRLTSAHDYSHQSLGVYRFLCCLQGQGLTEGLAWSWGPLQSAPFLPRVTAGRVVLSRATWNLGERECTVLGKARGSSLFASVRELKARSRWPRWVVLCDGDNELPIDLDSALSVETFSHALRGLRDATIKELLPGPDELVANGPEGRFVHEVVVPFVRRRPPRRARAERRHVAGVRRRFEPWSEWLYLKLYAGSATADRVLVDVVAPVVRELTAEASIDRWHFVRYADPDVHVRARLHGDPEVLWSEALPRLRERSTPLIEQGLVRRVQLDTYEREVERYGRTDEAMELSEGLFHADSEAALGIIEVLAGGESSQARWRLALVGMHQLLVDFGLDLPARLAAVAAIREGFSGPGTGRDLRLAGSSKKLLGARFRDERELLLALLTSGAPEDPGVDEMLAGGLAFLRERSAALAPMVVRLRALGDGERPSLTSLLSSYLHMHANRLLRVSGGAEELVIYDFLCRLYWTLRARAGG